MSVNHGVSSGTIRVRSCCPSVIMSSFVLDRNVPLIGLPRGGQIGANADEQEGVGTSGSAGWSAQQATAGRGCQWTAAGELPAGQAAVEAVSGGRSCGAEASQRGAKLESRPRQEVSTASAAASAGKVRRSGGRALWADAGDRTLGVGGRAEDSCRNAAALDASGRVVEPGAKTAATPFAARAQRAFWGDGADGRQLPRLAGRAGTTGCLIDLVDDATSTTWAQLGEQETIWAVVDALRAWIERYGVPQSVYVDWKNLYKRAATVKEQLRGEEPVTQFGSMCAKLGIAVIAASSPQAKGRVERQHGTHQDRLVKKLRRQQISSHEVANVYLKNEYLPEHNRRFARTAAKAEDYHRRALRGAELDRIFRLENERTISNDGVVRYQNRWLQLAQSRPGAPAQDKVLVCEGRHGNIAIEYRGRALRWQEIPAPRRPIEIESKPSENPATQPKRPRVQRKWVPPSNHPWREAARRGEQQRARKLAAIAAQPSSAWPSTPP